jgi:hypothetical protein
MTPERISRLLARHWYIEYGAGLACAVLQVLHPAGALGAWLSFLATLGMIGGITDVVIHRSYTQKDQENGGDDS